MIARARGPEHPAGPASRDASWQDEHDPPPQHRPGSSRPIALSPVGYPFRSGWTEPALDEHVIVPDTHGATRRLLTPATRRGRRIRLTHELDPARAAKLTQMDIPLSPKRFARCEAGEDENDGADRGSRTLEIGRRHERAAGEGQTSPDACFLGEY